MAGLSILSITSVAVSVHSSDLRHLLDSNGLIGPFHLSASTACVRHQLIAAATTVQNPRNLHARLHLARQTIADPSITSLVLDLFGSGYLLWRTNFFSRQVGFSHPGVALHHDKHFQSGNAMVNFEELGDHLSVVIGLDMIDDSNGRFIYLPGSHFGTPAGMTRDLRPFHLRPIEDHFPAVPPELLRKAQALSLPAGSFCLFHSALLHGSCPSSGKSGRTSMVARLVRRHCTIPANCASPDEISFYC